jgi:hypothetical protein
MMAGRLTVGRKIGGTFDRAAQFTRGDLREPCGARAAQPVFMEEDFVIPAFADFLKSCLKIADQGGHPGAEQQNPRSLDGSGAPF